MTPIAITTLTAATVQQDLQSDGLNSLGLTTLSLSPRWAMANPAAADYSSSALTLNLAALRAPFRGIREFAYSAAVSSLSANLTDSATSLTVTAGQGNRFPTPPAGKQVLLTLSNVSGSKLEVVSLTARAGDAFTIQRAALGTAKQSFQSGDRVSLRLSNGTRTSQFAGSDGVPLTGGVTILRLHPQAILRLRTLAAQRYAGAGQPQVFPVPWALVLRGVEGFGTGRWFEPDEDMSTGGAVSFHDGRGLILDPIYVAALFADLQAFLPGLSRNMGGSAAGAGGLQSIAALATGTLVHCLNLHGDLYRPALAAATLVTQNAANAVTGTVPATGLVTVNAGDGIAAAAGAQGRLRWGWAPGGILNATKLLPPVPAVPLSRPFFQLLVVDTVWSLLGNRTASAALGVAADDGAIPADVQPLIRDNVNITYLIDGPDVLGRASQVLTRPSQNMVLAVSPAIEGTMAIPAQPGPAAHWPQFPPPNTAAGFPAPARSPANGIAAAFASGNDVVVTVAADRVPPGAHIRIYPQSFVEIAAIAKEPSFVRADGGAAVAQSGVATLIFLRNPFNLTGAQPHPNPANLTMDIVVTPRMGRRKLWGAVVANVAAGPAVAPPDPFGGGNILGALPPIFESISPVPLFGIPTTVTPPGAAPAGVVGFVRALASETSPRQGPRLPTMARFETTVVTGTLNPPGSPLLWEAVLTGGRWTRETRSALHSQGNPGNPAGPDVHASGIHVTGLLAYDVARHAMRRAQPVLPLPGGATPGWLVALDGNNFNFPADTNTAQTGIGVFLETVAAVTETPELSAFTPPPFGTTVAGLLAPLASSLGLPAPAISIANEARLQQEVRREYIVSASGLRDALWSLRRAIHEARELIYIESPQFSATGATDLVAEIAAGMIAHPELRVLICTPRDADFAPQYRGWSRQHYRARAQAVGSLMAVDPERVAAFHPVGFPGRTAFIRTTVVTVDDVYSLVGATHWRRRGFTFDGSAAVASFDRQLDSGYSRNVRAFRRRLMAVKLGVPAPSAGASPTGEWLRLARPASAFDLIQTWLAEGGLGLIQPLWPGPDDPAPAQILPATDDMADPDGTNGATFLGFFSSLLSETGD